MATLSLEWGGDFVRLPNGSMQTAVGWDEVRQRIMRILLTQPQDTTNPRRPIFADNPFSPNFGVGLRRRVGEPLTQPEVLHLQQQITNAIMQDPGVDQSTLPVVTISQPALYTCLIDISVTLATGAPGQVVFAMDSAGNVEMV